mmetsp:Transcript_27907/g.47755  ORF Transcript_27907/g.47755 Transcript_27907/m.47755 type:complete len:217 (-) Transcript_27907:255-905(-)
MPQDRRRGRLAHFPHPLFRGDQVRDLAGVEHRALPTLALPNSLGHVALAAHLLERRRPAHRPDPGDLLGLRLQRNRRAGGLVAGQVGDRRPVRGVDRSKVDSEEGALFREAVGRPGGGLAREARLGAGARLRAEGPEVRRAAPRAAAPRAVPRKIYSRLGEAAQSLAWVGGSRKRLVQRVVRLRRDSATLLGIGRSGPQRLLYVGVVGIDRPARLP